MEVNIGRASDDGVETARLVGRLQEGSQDALIALYERHHDALVHVCMRRLNDKHEAEDVAQEAFLRAWQSIDTLQGERLFYPWIRTIATNLCNEVYRRRLRISLMDELETASPVVLETESQVLSHFTGEAFAAAFSRLGKRQQRVLEKRASGLSYALIASETGLGLPAVKSLILRGRAALRRAIDDLPGGVLAILVLGWSSVMGSVRQAAARIGEIALSASATAQSVTSGIVVAGPALATAAVVVAAPLTMSAHRDPKPVLTVRSVISSQRPEAGHVNLTGRVAVIHIDRPQRPLRHSATRSRAHRSDLAQPIAPPTTATASPPVEAIAPVTAAPTSVAASAPPSAPPEPSTTTTTVVQAPVVRAPKALSPIGLAATTTTAAASSFVGQVSVAGSTGSVAYQFQESTASPVVVAATGAVSVAGAITAGTYMANGTYSDSAGDTGPWTFALTVAAVALVQSAPFHALVAVDSSAGYTGQLGLANAVGSVTFTQQSAARSGLVVSTSGAISTTGVLWPGAYSISGTVADAAGDTGRWAFTLYVSADRLGLAGLALSLETQVTS